MRRRCTFSICRVQTTHQCVQTVTTSRKAIIKQNALLNMKVKIHKCGPKLTLYFTKDQYAQLNFAKRDFVEIEIAKRDKQKMFLTKFNQIISLRNEVVTPLDLIAKNLVDISVRKARLLPRTADIFKDNKIDMLSLIPEKTKQGYEIIVTEFNKDDEDWLRCWYCHYRGSGRQIEIRRFVDMMSFGNMLGQYQAEGTKYSNTNKLICLCFVNKLIAEHIDFLNSLVLLGIEKRMVRGGISYNPHLLKEDRRRSIIKEYETRLGLKVKETSISNAGKGAYGFRTIVRSTLITEIVLFAMNKIRTRLSNTKEFSIDEQLLADAFLAKLLTGDGTLDIRIDNREYDFPCTRIKIVDGNLDYLKDYYKILENLKFRPKLRENYKWVKAICSFEKLLYFYKICAFKNSNNWNKLLVLIRICLNGRRLNTHNRFIDLSKIKVISSLDIAKKYNVHLHSATDWLRNKVADGYLECVRRAPFPVLYKLTSKAIDLANTLIAIEKENKELIGSSDPYEFLEALKVRS